MCLAERTWARTTSLSRPKMKVLLDSSVRQLMLAQHALMHPIRCWFGDYLGKMPHRGQLLDKHLYLASRWNETLSQVLAVMYNEADVVKKIGIVQTLTATGDVVETSEDNQRILETAVAFMLSVLAQFHEYALTPTSFPWACLNLLDSNPSVRARCLQETRAQARQ